MPARRLCLALALWWAALTLVLAGAPRLGGVDAGDSRELIGAEKPGPGKDIVASQQTASPRVLPAPLVKRLPRHLSALVVLSRHVYSRGAPALDRPSTAACAGCVRVRRHIPRLNSDEPPWHVGT